MTAEGSDRRHPTEDRPIQHIGLIARRVGRLMIAGLLLAPGFTRIAAGSQPYQGGVPQVTLFGVLAIPGATDVDKDLESIAPQLRKLLPGHGFKLLASRSRALPTGQSLDCPFGQGWSASALLITTADVEGKVQFRFTLNHEGEPSFQRIVRTPPNQLFFTDVRLADGNRLVIGLGAR